MNHRVSALAILLLSLALCALSVACTPRTVPENTPAERAAARYAADLTFDADTRCLEGAVRIEYAAPYADCEEVWLWAPRAEVTAVCEGQSLAAAKQSVYVRLSLPRAFAYGETIPLDLHIHAACQSQGYTTYATDFLPLAVAWRQGYRMPAPLAHTSYAQLDEGSVDLCLHMPKAWVAACVGHTSEATYTDTERVAHYVSEATQSTALYTSPYWMRRTAEVGDVTWEYYATSMSDLVWQHVRACAEEANALWGRCPVDTVRLVQTAIDYQGGGLATVTENHRAVEDAVLSQWCRQPIRDDCPWIGVSLRAYLGYMYRETYLPQEAETEYRRAKDAVLSYGTMHGETGECARLDAALSAYDAEGYATLLRDKGLCMWRTLADIDDGVRRVAVDLARRSQPLTWDEVANALRHACGTEYAYFLSAWLGGEVIMV